MKRTKDRHAVNLIDKACEFVRLFCDSITILLQNVESEGIKSTNCDTQHNNLPTRSGVSKYPYK